MLPTLPHKRNSSSSSGGKKSKKDKKKKKKAKKAKKDKKDKKKEAKKAKKEREKKKAKEAEAKKKAKEDEKAATAATKAKEKECKARGKVAEAILAKISGTRGAYAMVMATATYITMPPAAKQGMEDVFRQLVTVETQAKACRDDNTKPLPDGITSLADAMALIKKATKEKAGMDKLLALMEKATGGA